MPEPHPHGGSLAESRARFPGAPEPLLDLSTGINPTSYPAPQHARTDRLPEPGDGNALEAAAAAAYRFPADAHTVAGPGTGPLMTLIALLSRAPAVAIVGPTYGGHARAWSAAGARILDVATLEAALDTGSRAIVLTRPNNPDGRVAPVPPLPADRLLIVDEAFADLEPAAADLAPHATSPGLILLRSFGKTYGLPGIRLAFAGGADPLLPRLRAALGPWPVSAHALAAGLAALPDAAWRASQRQHLARAAARLDSVLHRHGLAVQGGTVLFRLATHADAHADAHALWQHLGQAGILVRRFPERPAELRFGIPGTRAALARLDAALEKAPHRQ